MFVKVKVTELELRTRKSKQHMYIALSAKSTLFQSTTNLQERKRPLLQVVHIRLVWLVKMYNISGEPW